jgi:hypothetical protein
MKPTGSQKVGGEAGYPPKIVIQQVLKMQNLVFFVLLFLVHVNIGLSQSTSAGSSITGVVQDPSSAVIQGAQVVLKRDSQIWSTTTDPTGSFRFEKLLAGDYELKVQLEGFKTMTSRVRIGSSATTPVKITLQISNLKQQITVSAEATQVGTNSAENQNAVSMSGGGLGDLPVFDQDYISTMSRFLDQGAVATGGVALVVDGVEANGPGVSPSAIQEVKINNDPYSAQYSRPGRGRIEITTKSGSPEYHGTFNFIFRDYHLNARDAFAATRPPEQRRIYEGSMSGPLGHSKTTSFLISLDRQELDQQSIVYAQGPSGPIQENVSSPQSRLFASGRIHHYFSDTNDLWIGYSYEDRSAQNQGVGGFVLPEAGSNSEFREDEITINHKAMITPKLLHQLRFLVGQYHAPVSSINPDPKIVVQGAFTGGGAQADQLRTEHHFDLTEVMSYQRGKHQVKFGVDIPDVSRRGFNDHTNFGGTFYFSSLQDYQNSRPYSFIYQSGNGRLMFVEKVLAGFVQDEIQIRPNFTVSAGLRYYWQNYFHDDPNNFAPRLSFAYAPGKSRRTVIRGGAGFFYDRTGPGPIADTLRYDGQRLLRYIITNPGYPDPFPPDGSVTSEPSGIVQLDPSLGIPYIIQFSGGVEQQIHKSTVSIMYIGSRGIGNFRSRDVNAPLPPNYDARPDSSLGQVRQMEAAGRQVSDALELSLRGNVTKYFSGMAQYTLNKAYNNTSGIGYFPSNMYDLSGEWSRADFDQRHRFNMLGTFTAGKLIKLGVGLSLASGAPYTVTTGLDDYHTGLGNARPPEVFRNSLQGSGSASLDLRWSHDFFLVKSKKEKGPQVTIALDAFNVTNRVNFINYVGTMTSPFFGQPVASLAARRLQLGLRFQF